MPAPRPACAARPRARGFTLVELLVALFVMAVIASLAWQGVDGMLRTRDATREAMDRSLRTSTVLAQWEQDFAALYASQVVPALQFDGRTLRLTRTAPAGVQVVAWALRDGAWWRWAGPVTTRRDALQQHWLVSQQLQGNEPGQLRVIDAASGWQVYFYRGNGWSNAQSTGDLASRVAAGPAAAPVEQLPTGVRLVIDLPEGALTRDLLVPAQAE